MEQSPRGPVKKWLTIALFAVLIASFALWGVGDIFRDTGGRAPVIRVGEVSIGPQEFARSFQRQFNQMRRSMGGDLDIEQARQIGLVDRITQQIANRALFDAHARDMNLLVGEEQLLARITEQQAFQDDQGNFVRARFETALQRSGMNEQEYTELLRTDIHRQNLLGMVVGATKAPAYLAENLFQYLNERRVARYALVADSDFKVAEPAAAELRDYYEAHDQPFMAPPYRELTLIHLTKAQLISEVKVTEDAARQAYERRKDEFTKPERRELRQIVFTERAKAAQAAERLRGGGDLATVARDLTGGEPVKLGSTTRADLLEPLREPVFGTDSAGVVGPVESSLGWHVVAIDGIQAGESKSFEAVRDKLRRDLASEKAVDALVSLANNLDDELASGAKLEEAARSLGLDTRHIPAIDRQGRNRQGQAVPDLPAKEPFLNTAFNTEQGQQSLLKETQEGGYFVLRVDSVTPEQKRPFDSVKDKVTAEWTAAQRRKEAREAAQKLRKAVEGGTAFDQAAKLVGVEVATSQPLARRGNQDVAPVQKALVEPLFQAKPDSVVRTETDKGVVVGELIEIRTPEPSANPQELARIEQRLRQGLRNDLLQQYVNALRQRYQLRVNQSQMDSLLNRMY